MPVQVTNNKNKFFTISQAAEFLGVSSKTLRRWDKKGILSGLRTTGGQRRYSPQTLEKFKSRQELARAFIRQQPIDTPHTPHTPHTPDVRDSLFFRLPAPALLILFFLLLSGLILSFTQPDVKKLASLIPSFFRSKVIETETYPIEMEEIRGKEYVQTADKAPETALLRFASIFSNLLPGIDDTYNIGSETLEWKNLYIDGTAYIDEANIGGVNSDLLPSTDGTYDLGSSSKEWQDLYIDGTANIDILQMDDDIVIKDDNWVGLGNDMGRIEFDDQGTDEIKIKNANLVVQGSILPFTHSSYNLGSSSKYWDNLYINNIFGAATGVQGHWQRNAQAVAPTNITDDILVGHIATASAIVRLPGTTNENAWFNLGTGNLGIGTTGPGSKLDVAGTVEMTGFKLTTSPTNTYVLTSDASGVGTWQAAAGGDFSDGGDAGGTDRTLGNTDNYALGFLTNNIERLWIKNDGYIGIGTTNPAYKLEVNGTLKATDYYSGDGTQGADLVTGGLTFKDGLYTSGTATTYDHLQNLGEVYAQDGLTGNAVQLTAGNGDIRFYNDSPSPIEMLFLDESSGYVGIGTTAPAVALEIGGSGNLRVGGLTASRAVFTDASKNLVSTGTSLNLLNTVSDETGSGLLVFATSPSLTTPSLGVASATSINKVAITAPASGSILTIADGKTLTVSNSLTLAGNDATTITFQGTDTYVGRATTDNLTNKTLTDSTNVLGGVTMTLGSDATGDIYYRSAGNLLTRLAIGGANQVLHGGTTPSYSAIGASDITADSLDFAQFVNAMTIDETTSINLHNIADLDLRFYNSNDPAEVLFLDGSTNFVGIGTTTPAVALEIGGSGNLRVGGLTASRAVFTDASKNLVSTGASLDLLNTISDETGSGLLVFATSPSLTTPSLGVATATSINKLTITAPASGSILTIADGKTLTVSNSLTLAGNDATTITFQGTDTYVGRATTDNLTNKTLTDSTNVLGGVTMTLGSDATGDIYYRSAGNLLTRLAIGGANQVLHGGTTPSYSAIGASDITADSLDFAQFVNAMTIDETTSINLHNIADLDLRFYNSNDPAEVLFLDGSTNFVGIGTTAPAVALEIGSSGNLRVGGLTASRAVFTDASKNLVSTGASLDLLNTISDETGSGLLVFATSPSLTTPSLGVATATSINKLTITAPASGSILTIADGKTLTVSNSLTLAGNDATTITFQGTDTYVGRATTDNLTNKTLTDSTNVLGGVTMTLGSDATGDIYYRSAGNLLTRLAIGGANQVLHGGTTPSYSAIGASDITADSLDFAQFVNAMTIDETTSINLHNIADLDLRFYNSNDPAEVLFLDGSTNFVGIGTTAPAVALEIGSSGNLRVGGLTASRAVFTDASKNLVSTGASLDLLNTISDETGSGLLVFATSPSLTTPSLGVATATSINKLTITAPASGSTLTIADGKTLTVSNSLTLAGNDATTITFQGTDTYVGRATTDNLTNKTLTDSTNVLGGVTMTLGSDATGDIYYRSAGNLLTRLAIGGANQVLHGGTTPSYSAIGASDITADSLDFAQFEDTMDLDANLTLNQTAYTWTQNFTGDTTTGLTYNANSLTSGTALALSSTATAFNGELLTLSKTGASGSTAFTSDIANIAYSQTFNGGVALNSTGNVLDISRSITLNNDTNIHTISGALATLSDSATQTLGTLTHTANVLDITQNYTSSSGTALYVKNYGGASSDSFRVDDVSGDTTPFVIDHDGNVGIGTTNPSHKLDVIGNIGLSASSYINWGSTDGDTGYGFKDNSGTLQYKNSAGSWANVGSGGGSSAWDDITVPDANLSLNLSTYTTTMGFTGTSTTGWTYNADSLTSGIGHLISVDALSSGKALSITSTSAALTTGNLLALDWDPASTTTATGDLVSINIGSSASIGNLINITDNGSSLFAVSETNITSALPHQFTAAGDVSIAYDLVFTNQTIGNIESYGPLNITSGESFENNDLTLKTYGTGNLILDIAGGNLWADGTNVGIGTTAPSSKFEVNGGDIRVTGGGFIDDGTGLSAPDYVFEVDYQMPTIDELREFISINKHLPKVPSMYDTEGWASLSLQQRDMRFLEKIEENVLYIFDLQDQIDQISSDPGSESSLWEKEEDSEIEQGMLVSLSSNAKAVLSSKVYDDLMLGVVGEGDEASASGSLNVISLGRTPVQIAPDTQPIAVGDYLTSSETYPGMAQKAEGAGFAIGKALAIFDPSSVVTGGTINVNLNLGYYPGEEVSMDYLAGSGEEASSSSLPADATRPNYTIVGGLQAGEVEDSESTPSSTLADMLNAIQNDAEVESLTITGDLMVLGESTVSDLGVTGSITAGLLSIDGLESTISSLTGPVKITSLTNFNNSNILEVGDDLFAFDSLGNLEIKEGVIIGNEKMRNTELISAGAEEIYISREWEGKPKAIVATPTWETNFWVSDISETGFKINFSDASWSDKEVYWMTIW